MLFKSRQVNLDPEPWITFDGIRVAADIMGTKYDPRNEFEPTRDPHPWTCKNPAADCRASIRNAHENEWAPRRDEFDTPVNPVLDHFRNMHGHKIGGPLASAAAAWRTSLRDMQIVGAYTEPQVTHARKVLSRLAALA